VSIAREKVGKRRLFDDPMTTRVLATSFVGLIAGIALLIVTTHLHHEQSKDCVQAYFALAEKSDGSFTMPRTATAYEQLRECVSSGASVALVFWSHIAALVLILSVWHAIAELFVLRTFRKDQNEVTDSIAANIAALANSVRSPVKDPLLNITDAHAKSKDFDFEHLVQAATTVTVVVGGAQRWIQLYGGAFRQRHRDGKAAAKVVMVSPESEIVAVLARKRNESLSTVKAELERSIVALQDLGCDVFLHKLLPHHHLLIADSTAIFSPYAMTDAFRFSPALRIDDSGHDHCFFRQLRDDVNDLMSSHAFHVVKV
jgi:hypothetical protein